MLRKLVTLSFTLILASCVTGDPGAQVARVERLEIISRTPAFGGKVFEDAGAYETIVAVAHMRINAGHEANRQVADLGLADASGGWVSYKTDVVLLRPTDPAKASRVLLLDVPNRGGKLLLEMVNEASGQLDTAADAGNGFLMRRGHTLAWVGWQGDIALNGSGKRVGAEFPTLPGVSGASWAEAVFDDIKPTGTLKLAYPALTQDQAYAELQVRAHSAAAPTTLPASAWRYDGDQQIEITRPRGFDGGAIYHFRYQARDPKVMGLGMAALRDVTSFLKAGGAQQGNPLADIAPKVTLIAGVSQSGRLLRDMLWQGFNANPRGGKVFDGAMPLIAGSRKSFVNVRFGQPGRYSTQHIDHLAYGDQFPFSYGVTIDPVSGRTDGIFARCKATDSCPKLMHIDSSVEFWQARASLVVTDGAGRDIDLPDDTRAYLMSSTQHMAARTPTVGICKYFNNPAEQAPTVRVMLDHLVDWVRHGKVPPPSRYPSIAAARLALPTRDAVGFPNLSAVGIDYPQVINELTYVDYSEAPPRADPDARYQVLVPMTDQDGHDMAGIRLPDVEVPLATHSGWNLRRQSFAEGQLCGLNGMYAPLPATPRAGDPRRAISERYKSRLEYAKAVALAARALRDQGYMLEEDVTRFIDKARNEPRVKP